MPLFGEFHKIKTIEGYIERHKINQKKNVFKQNKKENILKQLLN